MSSHALLDQLEQRWRRFEMPITDRLGRGLSDAEIDSATEELGVRLPEEARRWWRWRDAHLGPDSGAHWVTSSFFHLSLAQAVDETLKMRQLERDVVQEHRLVAQWHDGWIAWIVDGGAGVVVFDCSDPGHDATPVRYFDYAEGETLDSPLPSVGSVVRGWLAAYDAGVYNWNSRTRKFSYHPERVDPTSDVHLDLV